MSIFATVIDTQALLETCAAALVAGVGVAFTFSLAILGSARVVEASRSQRRLEAAAAGLLAVAGVVATGAAIVAGIVVMTS